MESGKPENAHFLLPGALFAQSGEWVITTVLGSCIAVCLWDSVRQQGGMNHYKLPLWNGDGLPSPKFGNIAIQKLLENLMDLGSERRNLQAKVFGGAAVIQSASGLLNVGERNIAMAKEMLETEAIRISAADVGGELSRKIIFNTRSGSVLMKKANPQ